MGQYHRAVKMVMNDEGLAAIHLLPSSIEMSTFQMKATILSVALSLPLFITVLDSTQAF